MLGEALARDEATVSEDVSVLRQALGEDLTDPEAAPVVVALARALGRAGDAGGRYTTLMVPCIQGWNAQK